MIFVVDFGSRFTVAGVYLNIQMAGIDASPRGTAWLDSNLINETIWFRLLESADQRNIHAIIMYRSRVCLLNVI